MKDHDRKLLGVFAKAIACIVGVSSALHSGAEPLSDEAFFSQKVQPLLTQHCLKCHSHDAGKMKGGLTLDSKSGWQTGGDSGPAIVPGDPDKSLLITAVKFTDPFLEMPPKKKLADAEIAILVEWVKRGAPDPRKADTPAAIDSNWWSLKKLEAPEVPGDGHPIDAFIRKRLADAGAKPAPAAERGELARRLYVDLHGYMPTPEEVQAFVSDADPQAYAKLVDQLLASPRYGERWARHWLDVVHYADTHGCEHDVKRVHAWRYRDYVINRLNDDVPYGRFVREQLATDVFFPDEPQLTPALGFISAGPLELSRAVTAPKTFDYLDRDDMVTQTMGAIVSTTANCARCHTHKFDPITQEDYFALQAVFAGIGKGEVKYDTDAETHRRRGEMTALATAANKRDKGVLLDPRYTRTIQQWVAARKAQDAKWQILDPEVFVAAGGATLTKQADNSIFASGTKAPQEVYTVSGEVGLDQLAAVRLEVMKDERLPMGGPGRAGNGNMHLTDMDLQWFAKGSDEPLKLKIARATADFDQNGWTAKHAIDGDAKTGWAIHPKVNETHYIVFEFEKPVDTSKGGRLVATLKQLPPTHHIGRFRLSVTDTEEAAVQALPEVARLALDKPADQRTESEALALAAVALDAHAHQQLKAFPPQHVTYAVSTAWSHGKELPAPMDKPKVVHLLRRGDIEQPMQEVGPGALLAIKTLPGRFNLEDPNNESTRRAALADWLAHRDNPLTWRSIVNRVWHYHFGRGLVDTPNDFGRMGSEPTHPELLDWLAVWFRDEAKGSLKELHKLILTSATWQQTSKVATNSSDADNRLLGKMNRLRIDAEVFRDSVLRMSGQLDLTMGGPGVEQFVGISGKLATTLDYNAYDWNQPSAKRRSIYRLVWRTIPDPFMEALDFPDLGILAPKRGQSLSALQSLAIFNNNFVLHGSEWIGQRVQKEHPDDARTQATRAVQLIWQRSPDAEEVKRFVDYIEQHGITAFCRVLLNSNEFLFLD